MEVCLIDCVLFFDCKDENLFNKEKMLDSKE